MIKDKAQLKELRKVILANRKKPKPRKLTKQEIKLRKIIRKGW